MPGINGEDDFEPEDFDPNLDEDDQGADPALLDDEDEFEDLEDEQPAPRGAAGEQDPHSDRRPSRAQQRITALAREKADLQRQLDEARQPRPAPQPQLSPAETEARRREYLSSLDPETRTDFLLQEQARGFQGQIGQVQMQLADTADRTAFSALCAEVPAYKAVAAEVETRLTALRAQGQNVSREAMAKFTIGERAIARASQAGGKQRAAAERTRQAQTARPGASRSDVAPQSGRRGGNEAEERRKRLENVEI